MFRAMMIAGCIAAVVFSWIYWTPETDKLELSPEVPTPEVTIDPDSTEDILTPTPSATKTETAPTVIDPSPPVNIFIPNDDPNLAISTVVKPMAPCQELIDPPRGEGAGDIYYCTDFAMPGTNSGSKTVIAGHASKNIDTWLNRLQSQGDSMVGKQILLQTEASGDQWLVYTVSDVFEPTKEQLPYMTEVWGAPGQSTSNRLVVVTCLIDGGRVAANNYVVVAELTDVKG